MTHTFKVGDRVRSKSYGTRGTITSIDYHSEGFNYFLELTPNGVATEPFDERNVTLRYLDIEHDTADLYVGDKVRKVKGYQYPGVVVAVFTNTKGEDRYVIECTVSEVAGMLHIFNRDQLEKVEG